jgi:hypothetical protein
MAWIKGVGFLAIVAPPSGHGLRAVLLDTFSNVPATIVRRLVYAKNSSTPVLLRDEYDAKMRLAAVVESGGALPPGWIWDPPATFGSDDWVPRRLEYHEAMRGVEAFQWQGAAAKWSVMSFLDKYVAKRNGRMMKDKHGRRRVFPTMDEAKTFCEEHDQSLMVR